MNPLLPVLLRKLAAEQKSWTERAEEKARRTGRKIKKELVSIGSGRISRKELKTIKKQLKKQKPKTEEEKRIEQLAGPSWTKGRYTRGALIGATLNTAATGLSRKIMKQRAFTPRSAISSSAVGAIYGSALPAVSRLADIEAAKAGVY